MIRLSSFALLLSLGLSVNAGCSTDVLPPLESDLDHGEGDGDEEGDGDGDESASGDGDDSETGDGDDDDSETGDGDGDDAGTDPPSDLNDFHDPGTGPWEVVAEADVASKCKMDIAALKSVKLGAGFAVSRYGLLCYSSTGGKDGATAMWSVTKTLGALVTGIASYETRDIKRTGVKTGQLLDSDRADHWLSNFSYQKEARVAHVLAMVGHTPGFDTFSYDTVGSTQINTLSNMVSTAISQDVPRLGSNTGAFAKKFLFDAIGMTNSTWGGDIYAYSWTATLEDMLRVGLLITHRGVWGGKRILGEDWTYKMTHPSFESANTAYGYLTWLNAREGASGVGGAGVSGGASGDPCAPAAVWPTTSYPHGVSNAKDCTYTTSKAQCQQKYDVGTWSAQGLGGQFIAGHAGLDLVIVAKDYSGGSGPTGMWEAIRPALVALDPTYKGDDNAFCKAYAAGDYAPDLVGKVVAPGSAQP